MADLMEELRADHSLGTLSAATHVAQAWLADRYTERKVLAALFEEIIAAWNDAAQVWQDYQFTERTQPARGKGTRISDWLGERRVRRLAAIDARLDTALREVRDLTHQQPTSGDDDLVLIQTAERCLQAPVDDADAYGARAAIQRLEERITQAQLLLGEITSA